MGRLRQPSHGQRRRAQGRGARKLALGDQGRDARVLRRQGPRQQHHPDAELRPRPRAEEVRPENGPQQERHGGRRLGVGQDPLFRQAEPPSDELQLLRHRPEGHARGRAARGFGIRGIPGRRVQHHRHEQLGALQPDRVREKRGRRAHLRGMPDKEHLGRRRALGRPLLGRGRAASVRRTRLLPGVPLPRG